MSDMEAQEHFDEFFEEVFTELEDKVSIRAIPEKKRQGRSKVGIALRYLYRYLARILK